MKKGSCRYGCAKLAPAYAAYQKVTELDSEQGRAFLMMGYCALELGRVGDAREQLQFAASFPEQEKVARDLLKRAVALKS